MKITFATISHDTFEGDILSLSDDQFLEVAKEHGNIYDSVQEFENAFNMEDVSTANDQLRVIVKA